ncbi:MAG TPA: phosphodiester glycosidase family protein [Bacillota bacterium]
MRKLIITLLSLVMIALLATIAFGYGSFDPRVYYGYNNVRYKIDNSSYEVQVYMMNPYTESIACVVDSSRKNLENFTLKDKKIIAATNGSAFDDEHSFLGIYWKKEGSETWLHGSKVSGPNDSKIDAALRSDSHFFPSFCIKTDGSANIRWFNNCNELNVAVKYCDYIVPVCHPLVYEGDSVFESIKTDTYDNRFKIAPSWDELKKAAKEKKGKLDGYRFNDFILEFSATVKKHRTLLGHKRNGAYILVTTDPMNLRDAAKLMVDLDCDFAVNLDGGKSKQMRYNGKRVSSLPDWPVINKIGSAIVIYEK